MKYTFVACDVSPTNAFVALASQLDAEGHEVKGVSGKDGSTKLQVMDYISGADFLIVGMSSTEELAASELLALNQARAKGVRYGFFSDMRGCWRGREYFHTFYADASLLFVTRPDEAEEAQKSFPNAKVIAVGHPSRESDMMPTTTRDEVRSKLGIAHDTIVLLCAGVKKPEFNLTLLKAAQNVAIALRSQRTVRVVFSPHPKDETSQEQYRDVFDHGVSIFADPKEWKSVNLLPGADMLLNTMTSLFYEASSLRIPNVCYMPDNVAARRKELLGIADPPEEKEGTMLVARSPEELSGLVSLLCYPGSEVLAALRREQELQYGTPQPAGTAVRLMVEAIASITK